MKTKKLKNSTLSDTDLGNKTNEKTMQEEVAELKEVVKRIEALITKLLEVLPFHKWVSINIKERGS